MLRIDTATGWSVGLWLVFGFGPMLPWQQWANSADTPAWVQAIGSVGAILIAVYVSSSEGRRTRRARAEEHSSSIYLRAQVIEYTARAVGLFVTTFDDQGFKLSTAREFNPILVREACLRSVDQCLDGLNSFPLSSLSCGAEVACLFAARHDGADALTLMREAQSEGKIEFDHIARRLASLSSAAQEVRAMGERVAHGLPAEGPSWQLFKDIK